jgi:putative hemolysin
VTLEDALQQIFGEIGDEHDLKRPATSEGSPSLTIEGSTTIRDLETRYNIVLPGDAGFETVAGFLLTQFGYIPHQGEFIEHAGRRFTIAEMDRNRIATVKIEKVEPKQSVAEAVP